jgi:hypothetical protein
VTELRRHLRGCLACQADLRALHLAPAVVGALVPLPLLDRVWWPVDRLAELTTFIRVKVDSLVRVAGEAASGSTQFGVSGGASGLMSPGLAKALTVLCLGGVGVGGAAAVEKALSPRGPESARAASADAGESVPRSVAEPTSPDPRLMGERLRAPDRTDARPGTASDSPSPPVRTDSSRRAKRVTPSPVAEMTDARQPRSSPRARPTAPAASSDLSSPDAQDQHRETPTPSENEPSCSGESDPAQRPSEQDEYDDAGYGGGIDGSSGTAEEHGDVGYGGGVDAFPDAPANGNGGGSSQEASKPKECP